MRENLREYCLNYGREDLLTQWHISQNGDLTPEIVSFGSHKKYGGVANMDMNGKRLFIPEHGHRGAAVLFARAKHQEYINE